MSNSRFIVPFNLIFVALILLAGPAGIRLAAQAAAAPAQAASARPAPTPEQLAIQAASEKDHQRMMDLLGIKTLRPGATSWRTGASSEQRTIACGQRG